MLSLSAKERSWAGVGPSSSRWRTKNIMGNECFAKRKHGRVYITLGSYTTVPSQGIKKNKKKKHSILEMHWLKCLLIWFDLTNKHHTHCTAHDKREMGHHWTDWLTAYLFTFCYTFLASPSSSLSFFMISRQILFWVSFSLFLCVFLFFFPRYLIFFFFGRVCLIDSCWCWCWCDLFYLCYDNLFFEHILHIFQCSVYTNRKWDNHQRTNRSTQDQEMRKDPFSTWNETRPDSLSTSTERRYGALSQYSAFLLSGHRAHPVLDSQNCWTQSRHHHIWIQWFIEIHWLSPCRIVKRDVYLFVFEKHHVCTDRWARQLVFSVAVWYDWHG